MTLTLQSEFARVAQPPKPKHSSDEESKAPPRPISIRVSREERAQLESEAGERTISAYIRSRLLPRRRFPMRLGPHRSMRRADGRYCTPRDTRHRFSGFQFRSFCLPFSPPWSGVQAAAEPLPSGEDGCANGGENRRRAQPKASLGRPSIFLEVRRGRSPKPSR